MVRILIPLLCAALFAGTAQAQDRRAGTRDSAVRVEVTPEHLRTAFRDSRARDILNGARRARLELDSALISYDARSYQRVSVNLAFSALGRDHLAFRSEGATRVQYHRDKGALVTIEGARAVAPIVAGADRSRSDTAQRAPRDVASEIQLPYFPGSESLWIGSDVVRADVDERSIIHPLASGSEAYYKYESGDSLRYTISGGSTINLVELLIVPREAKWNLVVGSFWFDESNMRLVRAVYRLAVPLDVWSISIDDDSGDGTNLAATVLARAILNPMRGTVGAITVEYALHEQRFWLPAVRTAEGLAQVSFARVPFELQQKYEYEHVNGNVDIPLIPLTERMARMDSIWLRDSLQRLDSPDAKERARLLTEKLNTAGPEDMLRQELSRRAATGDTAAARMLRSQIERNRPRSVCDTASSITTFSRAPNRSTRIMTTSTCNDSLLINSPQLPPSIYTKSDSLLGPSDRERMKAELTMGLQSQLAPQRPSIKYGLGDGMMRYNRVEGLSPALGVHWALGSGLEIDALARIGTADHELNGEVGVLRSDGRRTMRVNGYRRLVAMNDWGNPLSFGASFQALVFGRDEGFYYRSAGAEVLLSGLKTPSLEWRLYAERHRNATVEAEFSLANALGDKLFQSNITADDGDVFGTAFRFHHSIGEDPDKVRLFTQLKGENALGDFAYARGLVDATVSDVVARRVSVALSISAGSSVGELPMQRNFSLGGTQSIRGQRPGTQFGDAFWMARAEIGTAAIGARTVLFTDFGWAGSRNDWNRQSRAISGAGFGWSLMDGLVRIDIARGIYPGKAWRFASYFEVRL